MTDVLNRDEKEAALARALGREFSRFLRLVTGIVADMSAAMGLPAETWQEHRDKLIAVISPLILRTATEQAGGVMDEFAFLGVDWGLVQWRCSRLY